VTGRVINRDAPASTGIIGSLRELGDGVLSSVEDRLELLAVEVQQEKFRLIQTEFWIWGAFFSGMMAITFASLAVVYLFWARLAVLGGLAALYSAAFVAIIIAFRRFLMRQPLPLEATLRAIRDDRACIRNES
jgi:uncharacterized membrane protein YqjE